MKNITIIIAIIVLVGLASAFVYSNSNNDIIETTNTSTTGTPQKIILSYKNGNYYPQTITVKSGQPVQISLDSSVKGCYRSFTISSLKTRSQVTITNAYVALINFLLASTV